MEISEKSRREMLELAGSVSFRNEMESVRRNRHNPFMKNGRVDTDAYIEFVTQYNEFINHQPKPFRPIMGAVM